MFSETLKSTPPSSSHPSLCSLTQALLLPSPDPTFSAVVHLGGIFPPQPVSLWQVSHSVNCVSAEGM